MKTDHAVDNGPACAATQIRNYRPALRFVEADAIRLLISDGLLDADVVERIVNEATMIRFEMDQNAYHVVISHPAIPQQVHHRIGCETPAGVVGYYEDVQVSYQVSIAHGQLRLTCLSMNDHPLPAYLRDRDVRLVMAHRICTTSRPNKKARLLQTGLG